MMSLFKQCSSRCRSRVIPVCALLFVAVSIVIAGAQPQNNTAPKPAAASPAATAQPAATAKPAASAQPAAAPAAAPALSPPAATLAARLQADIKVLTQYPTRVPGTPGNKAAGDYVKARFQQIGLTGVKADTYEVTVPVTQSATLDFGGQTLKVLPIYPNHVVPSTTPEKGITGDLIYAGTGRPSDYNGQKIEGNIVVLDFNSGQNWITAADLGAKAIIFLQPQQTMRGEAERKFATLPVEVPRFYAPAQVASALKAVPAGAPGAVKLGSGTLKSKVTWERVKTSNITGIIKGTDAELAKVPDGAAAAKGDTVVIDGYYDSMSVTPDLAPGAEAAGNCAALLELARHFKENPPKYSVMFVANGAHHVALAGMRNFTNTYLYDDGSKGRADEVGRYRAFIGLDLTSSTDTVGIFGKSWFYNQMGVGSESILLNQFANYTKKINDRADQMATQRKQLVDEFYVDGITNRNGRSWRSYLPVQIALDSEVATMAQKPGISFATANDARNLQDTPFDTADKLNLPNLEDQITTVSKLLGDLADINELPVGNTLSQNFGVATARAITRGNIKEKISFVPDTPIPDGDLPLQNVLSPEKQKLMVGTTAVAYVQTRSTDSKSYAGVRGAFVERATFSSGSTKISDTPGPDGKKVTKIDKQPATQFMFIGPRVGDPKGGGTNPLEVEAYSINRDGRIIFAPDMGSERGRFTPQFRTVSPLKYKDQASGEYESNASVMCFECRAVPIFDTLDQRYFTVLKELSVLDAQTDAPPVEYGFLAPMSPAGTADIDPVAIVFGRHPSRFKMIMAQGLLGKRLVVLNTDPKLDPKTLKPTEELFYEGAGVRTPDADEPDNPVIRVAYQTAGDLWILDQQRIRLLKGFGINNQRVDALHGEVGCPVGKSTGNKDEGPQYDCPTEKVTRPTGGALLAAKEALDKFEYDKFYLQSRRAFGLESRAYPDIEATSQDVLKGIVFYLALLLPFSFFLERLIWGFPDIRKQIAGFSGMFLAVFFGIRYVHPAFELALTPFIILLAFIILALTVVVTLFLSGKFEQEIKRLKQGVHFADVGRLSAISAAIGLGIANMRRRPTRTALTCVTLVLLTFTVLSFTSVTANITNFAKAWGDPSKPPEYAGLMVRSPDWGAMQEAAVLSMSNEFTQRFGNVARRAWYLSRDQGEQLYLRVSNVNNPDKFFHAPALVGLTPEEQTIGSPIAKTLLAGKWFDGKRRDVCLIPEWILLDKTKRQAQSAVPGESEDNPKPDAGKPAEGEAATPEEDTGPLLGLTKENAIGSKIQVAGQQLEIIGIFDNTKFRQARDLDGEEFTPVDYQSDQNKQNAASNTTSSQKGEEVSVQAYQHTDANALLLIPYDTAIMLGGTTRSMAAGFGTTADPEEQLNDLMSRAALGIFGATPNKGGKLEAKLYSSVETTSYEGFASLLVPILIAALIIANTMLGSVFERTREIGIYSAVGLAPIHVAALFIAEATVYAVLGSISGYLVAQVVAKIITTYNFLPGITLNYSSGSAVVSTLIVMATVLLSTIYPAWAAGRMSQPDIERKWRMSEPLGDIWRFQFPFTVSGQQPLGVAQFLSEFFQAHTDTSVGKFYTDAVFFRGLSLRDAVNLLNAGIPEEAPVAAEAPKKKARAKSAEGAPEGESKAEAAPVPTGPVFLKLEEIAADPELEVYHLAMRTWLAPFDMGVSQDTDIILLPAKEEGLYELQLRLARQSGEIAAWKRTNRGFISDLRRQLLLWRTIKPQDQKEYVLRGRAHVSGEAVPVDKPDSDMAAV